MCSRSRVNPFLIGLILWISLGRFLETQARLLLWDHSSRLVIADQLKSNDWSVYSEGPTVALPFSEWPMQRMIQENKTTLFLRLTFIVRDTSTRMLSLVKEEEGEACLIDGSKPPNSEGGSSSTEGTGFRVALRNRGTWSSVMIELPSIASLFLKTIIVPFAETDVDLRVNFLTNEVSARVSTRGRSIDATSMSIKSPTPLTPLSRWPQLVSFGADRHSLNKFSQDADWEVYGVSMKLGHISEGWDTARDYRDFQKGSILYKMNDPPVRFAKTLRTKINGGEGRGDGANFHLRIAFSFALTNKWRRWYDDSATTKPTDLDSPSLVCMVKPVSVDSRTNAPIPSGLRVWIKPDSASSDNFLVVEVGDGTGVSHRLQVTWPPILSGIKYNIEFLVFFLTNGSPDPNKLPVVRMFRDSSDLNTNEQVFLEIPKVEANRAIMAYNLWIASFGGAAFSSVVVGGPCRGVVRADAVNFKTESFVVESVEFTIRNLLPSTVRVTNVAWVATAPVPRITHLSPLTSNLTQSETGLMGFRRSTFTRGLEQRDSPRYVILSGGVNVTENPFASARAVVISGELSMSSCQARAWGQNLTDVIIASNSQALSSMPLFNLPNILTIAVDCDGNKIIIKTKDGAISDDRLIVGSSFQAFKAIVTMPSTSLASVQSDTVEINVGTTGTLKASMNNRLPRSNWGSAMWIGRETLSGSRIVYGSSGWTVRNVEISSFEYAVCTSIPLKENCDQFTNCVWNTKAPFGCRQSPTQQGHDATQTPTLGTRPPTFSPTGQPTTPQPTRRGETYAPSQSPTLSTPTPTNSPTIQPSNSPSSPTSPPTEYEYEYEEYEYEGNVPTPSPAPVAVPPPSLDTKSPTTISPTSASPTPSGTQIPTTPGPTPGPSPTASSTTTSPQFSPTSGPTGPSPTRSPTTIMPTSPSFSPSFTPSIRAPSASPTPSTELSGASASGSSTESGAVGAAVGTTFGLLALIALGGVFFMRYKKKGPSLVTAPPAGHPQELPAKPSPRKTQAPKPNSTDEPSVQEFDLL